MPRLTGHCVSLSNKGMAPTTTATPMVVPTTTPATAIPATLLPVVEVEAVEAVEAAEAVDKSNCLLTDCQRIVVLSDPDISS